jgi:hypothetical protein
MYKIKIFSDFCSSEKCKLNFEKVFNAENCEFYGESKQIYITNKINGASYNCYFISSLILFIK